MKCPNCGKPVEWKDNPFRPFCSERCKLIDFGAWANEEYTVPSDEPPPALDETGNIQPNERTPHSSDS
ncbi:MAG TPA: DNA gyrase inhibitor YacG [Pyrinomonadaceae bacterium]|nr:DNA gyrase inhibitor YacG [Pyrinomonadaceae bacterium]